MIARVIAAKTLSDAATTRTSRHDCRFDSIRLFLLLVPSRTGARISDSATRNQRQNDLEKRGIGHVEAVHRGYDSRADSITR